jgi:hypothetical protein
MAKSLFNLLGLVTVLIVFSGCAVHYYDEETGAEHVFGFGHLVMKVSVPEGSHQAIVTGTDIVGLGLGKNKEGGYLTLGWDKRRWIEIIDGNTTVDFIWPDGNFLNTRVGTSWLKRDLQLSKPAGSDHE